MPPDKPLKRIENENRGQATQKAVKSTVAPEDCPGLGQPPGKFKAFQFGVFLIT
jgi:hypothetical protein